MSLITRIFRVIRLSTRRRPAANSTDGAPTTLAPGELVYGEAENKFYICKNDSSIVEWSGGGGVGATGPQGPTGPQGATGPTVANTVVSDTALVPNSSAITNVVSLSQTDYDALVAAGQTTAATLYVINAS